MANETFACTQARADHTTRCAERDHASRIINGSTGVVTSGTMNASRQPFVTTVITHLEFLMLHPQPAAGRESVKKNGKKFFLTSRTP